MTQYSREIVQTEILGDTELTCALEQLCVHPSKAVAGDIMAVEFAWKRIGDADDSGNIYDFEPPSRVLVKQANGSALTIAWYVLETGGHLTASQISLIARCFSRASAHYSLAIFEHLADMHCPAEASLLIGPGYGGLLSNGDDDAPGEEELPDDDAMQKYIWSHSAVVLPPVTSNHERIAAQSGISHAGDLINAYHPIIDPRSYQRIEPVAALS